MDVTEVPEPPPIEWHRLGPAPLSRVSFGQALDWIVRWAGQAPFRLVVTPNVDHVIHLERNADFRAAYDFAALSLVDGMPVLWAARWLRLPRFEKISGTDLTPALCRIGAERGWRVFFVGGASEEELNLSLGLIRERFPGLTAGGACPPWGFENDPIQTDRLLDSIRAFNPDLLIFGCGSPKSEIWMWRHGERLGRGVGLSAGQALRTLSGRQRRAPRWMQRAGLEWLFRVLHEPRRLWHRYLVQDMRFFPLVWRWRRSARR